MSEHKILVSDFGMNISNEDILHHIRDCSPVPHGLMDLIYCRTCSHFLIIKIEANPTCWQVDTILFSAVLCAVSCVSDSVYGLCFPIAAVLRYFTVWAQLKLRNTVLGHDVSFVLYFGQRYCMLCIFYAVCPLLCSRKLLTCELNLLGLERPFVPSEAEAG